MIFPVIKFCESCSNLDVNHSKKRECRKIPLDPIRMDSLLRLNLTIWFNLSKSFPLDPMENPLSDPLVPPPMM